VRSYQVENDTAIDVSRSLARRDLKVGQIDSSHGCMAVGIRYLIRGAN
jgi:hypothetical protein